jgi:hypothetical protein
MSERVSCFACVMVLIWRVKGAILGLLLFFFLPLRFDLSVVRWNQMSFPSRRVTSLRLFVESPKTGLLVAWRTVLLALLRAITVCFARFCTVFAGAVAFLRPLKRTVNVRSSHLLLFWGCLLLPTRRCAFVVEEL